MFVVMVLIYWIICGFIYGLDRKSLLAGKRETIVYCVIGALGLLLSIGLLINSRLPGPTQWITAIYKPVSRLLEP
ncbi:hypothetical protein ACFOLF_18955 [Paenibacillus sepulcri]|uniref:Uncharacterized protein n=1 Tax=Paenibacillus sepulcri TaxID=359917 RepID=A0ABS7C0V0_9BACL|nr:hypothetical protein [Paenibacillus sepulcri]